MAILISLISVSLILNLCLASPSNMIFGMQESACQNATEAALNHTCWAALGCNAWFETWKGPCHGPPGCSCDTSKPWSDCALHQYQSAIDSSRRSTSSCVALTRPDLCNVSAGDWTKLSENQLAIAYASTAVQNLYHFVYNWYTAITSNPAPSAILSGLSNQIDNRSNGDVNRTAINIADFLTSLMTNHSGNNAIMQSFLKILTMAVGNDTTIDVAAVDIMTIQNLLGQALSKTLNATLSNWNTPYFDILSSNGALLDSHLENTIQLNQNLAEAPSAVPFDTTLNSSALSTNSTSRSLLSTDMTQIWNYSILECNVGEPGGLADQLTTLLDTMHNNLFHVMKETTKGRRSQYGFTQLFKTEKWIPIRRLYEYMYKAVGTKGHAAANQAIPDNRPVFICLQPENQAMRGVYAVCAAEPRLRAFQQVGTPYAIGLCPSFWALPRDPVRAFCPYKGVVNEKYTGNALQLNQQSIIVHYLVRIYLGDSVLVPERYGLNEVMKLDARDSYWNPSTWAYWYASVVGCTPLSWNDPEL